VTASAHLSSSENASMVHFHSEKSKDRSSKSDQPRSDEFFSLLACAWVSEVIRANAVKSFMFEVRKIMRMSKTKEVL